MPQLPHTVAALPEPDASQGWRKITFGELVVLTQHGPVWRRWRWKRQRKHHRTRLLLLTPDGGCYQFKLQRGAWIRPLTPDEALVP